MIVLGKNLYCGCRLWHIYFPKSVIETLRPLHPTSHSQLGSSKSGTRKKRSLPPQNEEDMTQKNEDNLSLIEQNIQLRLPFVSVFTRQVLKHFLQLLWHYEGWPNPPSWPYQTYIISWPMSAVRTETKNDCLRQKSVFRLPYVSYILS